MRRRFHEQLTLSATAIDHRHARELEAVGEILRKNPGILDLVLQDLTAKVRAGEGREGMSAEQVLRAALVKKLHTFTYDELEFHLRDSTTFRGFCGYGPLDGTPSRTTLQRNIKAITEQTWERMNRIVLGFAHEQKVEDGRKVRTDGTVTETNIHEPTDSSMLEDCVRVLVRLMGRAAEQHGVSRMPNRLRRAKRRAHDVLNAKRPGPRKKAYRDLLKVTREMVDCAEQVAEELDGSWDPFAHALQAELLSFIELSEQVIDQTERRVLGGETVPAGEKIVSIFEPHTDIIKKEKRNTHFGHKLTITTGRSGLVLDWVVEDGNPADSDLALRSIERQKEIYGRVPRQAAFDGCYASGANLERIKEIGVQDVAFSKKRGLKVLDMAKSAWVYKRLRNFRAGIEANISFLKRCFGLERCSWKGLDGFARYVGASIVAGNLLTLARRLA